MKRSAALVLAGLGLATAQDEILELQSQLPECALECIAKGAALFDCEVTDLKCSCSQLESITQEVAPCAVRAGCGMNEITGNALPPSRSLVLARSQVRFVGLVAKFKTDAASIVAEICVEVDKSSNDTVSTLDNDDSDEDDDDQDDSDNSSDGSATEAPEATATSSTCGVASPRAQSAQLVVAAMVVAVLFF